MKTYDFEFEKRAMLNKNQYEEIILYYKDNFIKDVVQSDIVNDYFDSDNLFLLKNKIVLRVRHSSKQGYILTLKTPLLNKEGDLETSQTLQNEQYIDFKEHNTFPEGPIKNHLLSLQVNILLIHYQSTLRCNRLEIKDGEFIIVLDKNTYNKTTDYNIEIEAPSMEKANKKILELAKRFNFTIKDLYSSKSRRALLSK